MDLYLILIYNQIFISLGIQVEDGGLFSCTAANEVGTVMHMARVNVFGPPTIRSMPNVTALAGEVTVLPCPAGGHPLTTISWSRGK